MAIRGTAITDVTKILQKDDITGSEKIPAMLSTSKEPQVVTAQELKGYINEGVQEVLESGINIKTINNTSILGGGNINVSGDGIEDEEMSFSEIDSCIEF